MCNCGKGEKYCSPLARMGQAKGQCYLCETKERDLSRIDQSPKKELAMTVEDKQRLTNEIREHGYKWKNPFDQPEIEIFNEGVSRAIEIIKQLEEK